MASKQSYKIPASIDRSILDLEIVLATKNTAARPIMMKVVIFWVTSLSLTVWLMMNSFIKDAPWWVMVLIFLWVVAVTFFYAHADATKELRLGQLPTLASYLPKKNRQIITRKTSSPAPFYSIVNIDKVGDEDQDNGVIYFSDGTFGRAFLVVGSASALLFDEDRRAILDRVDNFYRKISNDTQFITVTNKEPQRIHRQLAGLVRQTQRLEKRDPELLELLNEDADVLRNVVGGQGFKSIHQYLILKSKTREELRLAYELVRSEVTSSQLMIAQCTTLDQREVLDMLAKIYRNE